MTVLFSCRQQMHLRNDAAPFPQILSHPVLFYPSHPHGMELSSFFKSPLPEENVSLEFPGELQGMMGLMGSELQEGREKRLSNIL